MSQTNGIMYPPILDKILPAYDIEQYQNGAASINNDIVFYFQKPPLLTSSLSVVKDWHMHIQLVNLASNDSIINTSTGIYIAKIEEDKKDPSRLLVRVPVSAIRPANEGGLIFLLNTAYRLQMRFDDRRKEDVSPTHSTEQEFIDNANHFSEWSQGCILRFTARPVWYIRPFDALKEEDEDDDNLQQLISFNRTIIKLNGELKYPNDANEQDVLEYYYYQVYNSENQLVGQSEKQYVSRFQSRTIHCNLNLIEVVKSNINGPADNRYKLNFTGKTKMGTISKSKDYFFTISMNSEDVDVLIQDGQLNIEESPEMREEGIVQLNLHLPNCNPTKEEPCRLRLMRSSSLTNFEKWEDIYVIDAIPQKGKGVSFSFQDNTVQSCTSYQYQVILEEFPDEPEKTKFSSGLMGRCQDKYQDRRKDTTTRPDFNFASLVQQDKQLPLKFNFNISSFNQKVNRSKFDTIGGKYPHFAENAQTKYKQFSISGYISAQADPEQLFLNKKEIMHCSDHEDKYLTDYGVTNESSSRSEYGKYLYTNRVNASNDYLWEKVYREAALDWLNNGEPKLFRSQTEGNIIVMITDVALQPNSTLSRRLSTFSANVYEIGDGNNIAELVKNNILTVNHYKEKTVSAIGDTTSTETDENDLNSSGVKPFNIPYITAKTFSRMHDGSSYGIKNLFINQVVGAYKGIKKRWKLLADEIYFTDIKLTFCSPPKPYLMNDNGELSPLSQNNTDKYSRDILRNQNQIVYGYKFGIKYPQQSAISEIFVPAVMREVPLLTNLKTHELAYEQFKNRGFGISEHLWEQNRDKCLELAASAYYYLPNDFFRYKILNPDAYMSWASHLYYGYYQIPSNVKVEDILFYFDEQQGNYNLDLVSFESLVHYQESTVSLSEVKQTMYEGFKVGQLSEIFSYGTDIMSMIKQKHVQYDPGERDSKNPNIVIRDAYLLMIQWLKGVTFDVEPYSLFKTIAVDDDNGVYADNYFAVGGSGTLNLLPDYKIDTLLAQGKILTIVKDLREEHEKPQSRYAALESLQPWEAVIEDDKVLFDNCKSIINPVPQHIYTLKNGKTYIYYVDGKFYPAAKRRVNNEDMSNNSIHWVAEVPTQGTVGYCADIIKELRDPE